MKPPLPKLTRVIAEINKNGKMNDNKYIAYTGSCVKKKKGWAAFIILQNNQIVHESGEKYSDITSNQIEMMAIINAVNYVPKYSKLIIYSNSQYAIRAFENKCRQRANKNLINLYHQATAKKDVTLIWIKSRKGGEFHKYAKRLAEKLKNSFFDEQVVEITISGDNKYLAYTDGSCSYGGLGNGSAAYIVIQNGVIVHRASKAFANTTSNRMEMLAIISAVNYVPEGSEIIVVTDSKYAMNIFNGSWNPTKNFDMIDLFNRVSENKKVTIKWVKGHSGNKYNEMVDNMASSVKLK